MTGNYFSGMLGGQVGGFVAGLFGNITNLANLHSFDVGSVYRMVTCERKSHVWVK